MQNDSIAGMIEHWMNVFEDEASITVRIPEEKELKLANDLIKEEIKEYFDELDNEHIDIIQVADALGDSIWVIIRAMKKFGLDPYKVMQSIYVSNMSKLCDHNTLRPTIKHYESLGIPVNYRETHPGTFVVRNADTGKILKSVDWEEPNFNWIH